MVVPVQQNSDARGSEGLPDAKGYGHGHSSVPKLQRAHRPPSRGDQPRRGRGFLSLLELWRGLGASEERARPSATPPAEPVDRHGKSYSQAAAGEVWTLPLGGTSHAPHEMPAMSLRAPTVVVGNEQRSGRGLLSV